MGRGLRRGCGTLLRIFNPVLQGEKFDPEGEYVRHWVHELAQLLREIIHKPWTAGTEALARADVHLGKSYPAPIVDYGEARADALQAYERLRKAEAANAAVRKRPARPG